MCFMPPGYRAGCRLGSGRCPLRAECSWYPASLSIWHDTVESSVATCEIEVHREMGSKCWSSSGNLFGLESQTPS